MKCGISKGWRVLAMSAVLCAGSGARAQAPSGSTGQCKDGSYTTAAKKWQSCRGHQGVKTWFADASQGATPTSAATPAVAPSPATAPASPTQAGAGTPAATGKAASTPAASASAAGKGAGPTERAGTVPQAPGGGGGKVWLNTDSKVYHCEGTPFYGRTRAGKYVPEAEAKAAGARPERNKPCSK